MLPPEESPLAERLSRDAELSHRDTHSATAPSSTATLGCVVFAIFTRSRIINNLQTHTAKSGCAT